MVNTVLPKRPMPTERKNAPKAPPDATKPDSLYSPYTKSPVMPAFTRAALRPPTAVKSVTNGAEQVNMLHSPRGSEEISPTNSPDTTKEAENSSMVSIIIL